LKKVYKYRALSESLFKELYYQELYFASSIELNDPLDLTAKIEFSTRNPEAIEYLIHFIYKTNFNIEELQTDNQNTLKLIRFVRNLEARELLRKQIFKYIEERTTKNELIWISDITKIIIDSINDTKTDIVFDSEKFTRKLQDLTDKFIRNSYVTCFSERNDNYLMWSHYSSKHTGICLEFTLEENGKFPYEFIQDRKYDLKKYKKGNLECESKIYTYNERIRKVAYQDELPFVNFFYFSYAFENEYDCDLIGLSKSWAHKYAQELEFVFSTKTKQWKYEKEWRAIRINFDKSKEPEERISRYPIESLTAIYFGISTPENIKIRIYKLLIKKSEHIEFYESTFNALNKIEFNIWEYEEEE